MPKSTTTKEPRYLWPERPVRAACPTCGATIVRTRSFGRDVALEPAPLRDSAGEYGVDHALRGRCRKPSPF